MLSPEQNAQYQEGYKTTLDSRRRSTKTWAAEIGRLAEEAAAYAGGSVAGEVYTEMTTAADKFRRIAEAARWAEKSAREAAEAQRAIEVLKGIHQYDFH